MNTRLARKIARKYLKAQQPLRLQPDYGERNAADFLGEDERMSEFFKGSRLPSRKLHPDSVVDKAVEQWRKDNPEVAKKFDEEKVETKEEMMEKLKQAEYDIVDDIIDDMGLGRMASNKLLNISRSSDGGLQINGRGSFTRSSLYRKVEKQLNKDSDTIVMTPSYSLGRSGLADPYSGPTFELKDRRGDTIKSGYSLVRLWDEVHGIMLNTLSARTAKDHEQSGSYMSRQNLREMSDMADFIVDDIGMEGLDDWVEDKISQSYAALNDVARYRGYRDDHPHGDDSDSSGFKFADEEIIDDLEW